VTTRSVGPPPCLPPSFFEPVEGDRFGLVTCNPPYVNSPESEFLFRDSGLTGDTVSRDLVRRAPEFLEEGAFAQMLVSWVDERGGDWSAPLRSWVDGSGCDAWLLHHGTDDPRRRLPVGSTNRRRRCSPASTASGRIGEVAEEMARLQGASRDSVAQAALPVATQMLAAGFLERTV
jgi:hypothetical protein